MVYMSPELVPAGLILFRNLRYIYIYIYFKNGTPIFRLEISLDEKKYCFLFLFYFFFRSSLHPPPE